MLENINLTEKQEQVLNSLNKMLERNEYKVQPVSDTYTYMTAVANIVSHRWFDRTFRALIEKGLVEKVNTVIEITKGVHAGKTIPTYGYILTDLGFEYLGITNPDKTGEPHIENVIETLFTLQPVVDTPQETELGQYANKPEYSIYPQNVNSLEKVKEVVGIILNDVLSKKHQQLLLDEIHDGYFKVTFNSRLRTSLGRCCETAKYGKRHIRCIEFNPNYIKYEPDNNLKIDTIIHEICHAITDLETEESNMHGPKWQANCIKYGCSPTTGDKIVHYKVVMWEKGLISHRLVCVDCDKVIEYVNNPSKNYIYNILHQYYYHRQCGGYHLILETNPVNNK
nr:MAG TPA: SprT-like family [Caudoviricetes sp.]